MAEGARNHVIRSADIDTGGMLIIRVFLLAGWGRAGVEKIISADWRNGEALRGFARDQQELALPGYQQFLADVVMDFAVPITVVVILLQLSISAGLLTRRLLRPAIVLGIFLNLNFVLAGAVNPSAFYLMLEVVLLVSLGRRQTSELLTIRDWWDRFQRVQSGPDRRLSSYIPAFVGLAMLSFAKTLDPRHAVEDPALMLALLGVLTTTALCVTPRAPRRTDRSLIARRVEKEEGRDVEWLRTGQSSGHTDFDQ